MQNIPTKSTGEFLPATEFNQIPDEMETAIEDTGITLDGGDLTQLSKSIANYAGSGASYADSGSSTAYLLSPIGTNKGPTAYVNGMVVNFISGNTNTSTIPTANVNTLGVKTIEKSAGGSLSNGDIVAGFPIQLVFSTSADKFLLVKPNAATTTNSGILELATDSETQTGTDTIRAVTPAGLASFSSNLVAADGHAVMPGGLIIQWGTVAVGDVVGSTDVAVTFDISFGTVFNVFITNNDASSGSNLFMQVKAKSTTGATVEFVENGVNVQSVTLDWMAIGI